jgi:hypothetical protein
VGERNVRNAAAELERQNYDEGYGVIHGDFWTGKYALLDLNSTKRARLVANLLENITILL